jgi:hypothetical protein
MNGCDQGGDDADHPRSRPRLRPIGRGLYGPEIDFDTAVARRRAGGHVVVRGPDLDDNRDLAQAIEAAVGPWMRGAPHTRIAGPLALPHFQQTDKTGRGHTFYETPNRRARKRP